MADGYYGGSGHVFSTAGAAGPQLPSSLLLAPIDPLTLQYERALQLVRANLCTQVERNRAYYYGDHWYRGMGWKGPRPEDDPDAQTVAMRLIHDSFVSSNVVKEGIGRHNKAIIGRQPMWQITPVREVTEASPLSDEEKAEIAEINAALVNWWDKRKLHRLMKQLGTTLLWAERACWRLFVPEGLVPSGGVARADTLAEAFERFLYVEVPDPEYATVVEDPQTKRKVGIVVYPDTRAGARGRSTVEISWVDDSGVTNIRYLPSAKDAQDERFNWTGRIPVYQVSREEAWITNQLIAQQQALNLTLTLLQKGTNENAFLERIFLNAMMPGKWIANADGTRTFQPAPYVIGGKRVNFVRGLDWKDSAGQKHLEQPSVQFRPPTDETELRASADYWRAKMLSEMTQDYVLMNSDAMASGEARSQAKSDFINTTEDDRTQLDMAGTELLMLGLAIAEGIAKRPGLTKRYRIAFQCKPNYGPTSVPERVQVVAEVQAGMRSKANGMAQIGVDDPDAEQTAVEGQPGGTLDLASRRADVVQKWITAGFSRQAALELAGYSPEDAKKLAAKSAATVPTGEVP